MRALRRWIVPGLAPMLAAACFDFDATTAGGPLTDSGPPPNDASLFDQTAPSDAGTDVTTLHDAAPVADAVVEAAPDADAQAPPPDAGSFCAKFAHPDASLFFCDDFDEQPLPGAWQTWVETNGTMMDTTASARSLPTSVDLTTMPLANGQQLNVALRTPQALPTLPTTLRFAFSLEPLQIDTTDGAAIVLGAIDFLDNGGDRYTVGLAINVANGKPALALGEQSGTVSGGNFPDGAPPTFINHPLPPTSPLAMDAWSDLVIEVDWSAGSLEGKVYVNGNAELAVPLTMSITPVSLQIGVGTSYVTEYDSGLSPVWELRYDNVVFTAE